MIRPYSQNDRKELLAILNANVPLFFHPDEVHDFSRYLDTHADFYLVCQEDDRIQGGSGWYYHRAEKLGSVSWVFCRPDGQGKGYGTRLVEHCLALLREEKDLAKVVVRTSQLAFKFFQKFKFEVVRTEKNYWASGFDLYLMEMKQIGLKKL
jgi:ribosomal protein S18 acetylase RimI-like enzyme